MDEIRMLASIVINCSNTLEYTQLGPARTRGGWEGIWIDTSLGGSDSPDYMACDIPLAKAGTSRTNDWTND